MIEPLSLLTSPLAVPASVSGTGAGGTYFGSRGVEASRGLTALFAGIILIALIPLLFWAARKILAYIHSRREKSLVEELTLEARKREDAGEFVSAGLAYEKLNKLEKAAELYEKGRDFMKAADTYESMGRLDKVSEMYEMAGDLKRAAHTRMYSGDFTGAAGIYNRIGDKKQAAAALYRSGNKLAAARAYREAKDYIRASAVLKEAGMYKEAADMYAISLAGAEPGGQNLENFYTYGSLLEAAGDPEKAAQAFRAVSKLDPGYRDVRERLESLNIREEGPAPEEAIGPDVKTIEEPKEEGTGGKTTLRGLIQTGGMGPRHSFRLWVQVLKVLDRRQKEGRPPEVLTPESIVIDSRNSVSFSENTSKNFTYVAPEVVAGSPQDPVSSVYSMGVILYEMLTGSLDTFGLKRPSEVSADVPPWLELLAVKCCERKRETRYQGPAEVLSALVDLKRSRE